MFREPIITYLEAQGCSWKDSGHNYLTCQCPNPGHEDKNPSAFASTELGFIKCHSCGHYVPPSAFTEDSQELSDLLLTAKFNRVIRRLEESHEMHLSTEHTFELPPYGKLPDSKWRGLSDAIIDAAGIYVVTAGLFEDRTVIPFNTLDGTLVGYTGRLNYTPTDGKTNKYNPKYRHVKGISPSDHILFGELIDKMKVPTKTLVITEGVIDALKLIDVGIAATPSLGFRAPNDNFVLEAIALGVDEVVLGWDNDNAGMDKMFDTSATALLPKWRSKLPTHLGPHHDLTAWLYKSEFKDFGEVPTVVLKQVVTPLRPMGMLGLMQ